LLPRRVTALVRANTLTPITVASGNFTFCAVGVETLTPNRWILRGSGAHEHVEVDAPL
jgi:hypothetical protein